ncbi:MAG: S9 family peptidase [Alphaproteobacteria bacterium]|nr:S9 family peptidase [Alphaproteobacteria bacterium]
MMKTPLIPREILFGNPDRMFVRLSPNGQYISYIAPKDGVLNVWVAPRDNFLAATVVTDDRDRGIRSYFWAHNNSHILYIQDREGNEDWHIYSVNLETHVVQNLTPVPGIQARVVETSEKFADEILIAMNDRDPAYHDIYRVNVVSGDTELVLENKEFSGFVTDDNLDIRFGVRQRPDGGNQILRKDEEFWTMWTEIDAEDSMTCNPLGFDKTGNVLYMIDSRNRNTAALLTVDLNADKTTLVYENPKADINDVMIHPIEKTIQAASSSYMMKEWTVLDSAIEADLTYLKSLERGELEIMSRTAADDFWIAVYLVDNGPAKYYLYDRKAQKAEYLYSSKPSLENLPLVPMHSVVVTARDGLEMVCYYSLPQASDPDGTGIPSSLVPFVLDVHGGPWARDSWGYDGSHQWLANRGYGVMNVNFRGSTGLGKAHTNAGIGEWGAKMHEDLLDAVQWAVAQKIADPEKVAIIGGSYGGYAVLNALTRTPEFFACGIDIVGPSNLLTLMESIPPYWRPIIEMFKIQIGADPETVEGRQFLMERSPINHVKNIVKPLLIGQGANDPRVKQAESDQIVRAMQENRIAHTYVLFPDEGHGFVKPENRMAFFAIAEAFLAQNIGGACEPIGNDLVGSSYQIITDSYDLMNSYAA